MESKTIPMAPLPRPRRRWLSFLLVLVVFVSGTAVGGGAVVLFIARQARQVIRHPDEIPARLTTRLTRRLDLDAQQTAAVREIITQRFNNLMKVRRQVQPEVRQELLGVHTDVREKLNPDQQRRWDTLFKDLSKNWLPADLMLDESVVPPVSP